MSIIYLFIVHMLLFIVFIVISCLCITDFTTLHELDMGVTVSASTDATFSTVLEELFVVTTFHDVKADSRVETIHKL